MENYTIRTLIPEEELKAGIKRVADEINKEYAGKTVHLICVLKGGVYFLTELSNYITDADVTIDFMSVSSYGAGLKSTGVVKIIKDLDEPIEGKDVIIVEDIIDSGLTMHYLKELLYARKPNSITTVSFLDKANAHSVDLKTDLVGFEISNEFVVGYGLDYANYYRNLPYIGILKPECYE